VKDRVWENGPLGDGFFGRFRGDLRDASKVERQGLGKRDKTRFAIVKKDLDRIRCLAVLKEVLMKEKVKLPPEN